MYCLDESSGHSRRLRLLPAKKLKPVVVPKRIGKKPDPHIALSNGRRRVRGQNRANRGYSRQELKGLFQASDYNVRIRAFPTNEIVVRYQPAIGNYRETAENKANKRLAQVLENDLKNSTKNVKEIIKEKKNTDTKKGKSGWGKLPKEKIFNKNSQKFITRSLGAMECKFGKNSMRFLTLTLPGSTEAAMRVMSEYSAYIVNRINMFINRRLHKDSKYRVNVWERQKRGALHLHAVICSKNQKALEKVDSGFKSFCFKLFHELSEITGVDMFERADGTTWKNNLEVLRCNSEKIKKSVSRYMSKYLSKEDTKIDKEDNSNKTKYYPATWASWGRGVKAVLWERTVRLEQKRIDDENAYMLAIFLARLGLAYSPREYQNVLIYGDSIGYGVNVKMFVEPENMDIVIALIEQAMELYKFRRNVQNNYQFPDMNRVREKEIEQWLIDAEEYFVNEKYGMQDGRLWQKVFKTNKNPLPQNTSPEAWEEFYGNNTTVSTQSVVPE